MGFDPVVVLIFDVAVLNRFVELLIAEECGPQRIVGVMTHRTVVVLVSVLEWFAVVGSGNENIAGHFEVNFVSGVFQPAEFSAVPHRIEVFVVNESIFIDVELDSKFSSLFTALRKHLLDTLAAGADNDTELVSFDGYTDIGLTVDVVDVDKHFRIAIVRFYDYRSFGIDSDIVVLNAEAAAVTREPDAVALMQREVLGLGILLDGYHVQIVGDHDVKDIVIDVGVVPVDACLQVLHAAGLVQQQHRTAGIRPVVIGSVAVSGIAAGVTLCVTDVFSF